MTDIKAICDECGLETEVNFTVINRPNGVTVTQFKCDVCRVRYVAYVTNAKVRRLQKAVLQEVDADKREELHRKITEIMDELKRKEVG